jgi:hypothetical protein
VSETLGRLRRQARSLRSILGDLHTSQFYRAHDWESWHQHVSAPQTLGTQTSKWALTEHFLLTWIEWSQVSRLYSRYFGYGEPMDAPISFMSMVGEPLFPGLPRTWNSLHQGCQQLKDAVADDGMLAEIWNEAWSLTDSNESNPAGDVEHWYLRFVESHARRRLLEVFLGSGHPAWRELYGRLVARERLLTRLFESSPDEIRDGVLAHLRFYRHATLDVSWLSDDWQFAGSGDSAALSALRRLTTERPPDSRWIDGTLANIRIHQAVRDNARLLLARLQQAVWEIGYTCLAEDLNSPDFEPDIDTPTGTPGVQVNAAIPKTPIPKRRRRRPRRLPRGEFLPEPLPVEYERLLLFVGDPCTGWKSFARILDQAVAFINQSETRQELVVFLTACWDSPLFVKEHRAALRILATAGVRFLFFLAGVPDRRLSLVDVRL